mmetsp:Transcript_6534/g.6426  ORF Transcript_6534/g.6426 Transcript_6534/m.6426 type:complete len:300 (-) Transcript_6534:1317-2216(-)
MSFNLSNSFSNDLESSGADSAITHYRDFPEFDNLSQRFDNNLYNINNNQLVSIKNLLQQYENLHNKADEPNLSVKLQKISIKLSKILNKTTENFKSVNEITKKLNGYLNDCESNHEDEDTLHYLRRKESILIELMKSSMNQFQKYQRKFESLQQVNVAKYGVNNDDDTTNSRGAIEDANLQPQLQQMQMQIDYEPINAEELEQQSLLVEEREREIHQISQDISEINDIFLNLHDIVNEQQFSIDNIEDNILRYSGDVHGASNELRKAERYQRRSGGRMFCCLLILLGVVGSVILIGIIF